MLRTCVLLCAATVGFGWAVERPDNEAQACHRRRCCYNGGYQRCGYYGSSYRGDCCQIAYTNPCGYGYQGYGSQAYVDQYGNRTYYRGAPGTYQQPYQNQGTYQQQYQNGSAPPPPAPVPDSSTNGLRDGTRTDGSLRSPDVINEPGRIAPQPAPAPQR